MRKLLIACDGTHFSEGVMGFTRLLNTHESVMATGLFMPQVVYANLWSYASASAGPEFIPLIEQDESDIVRTNIDRFSNYCIKHKIAHQVHKDFYDFALPELKRESRFGDLLLLGSESFYANLGTGQPNEYLTEALHTVECPVMVIPEQWSVPDRNILACDGSQASIFAIKLFSYLFPEFKNNKTLLITLPRTLELDPRKYHATSMSEMKSSVLVEGSYSRSFLSELLRHSFVASVIRDHKVPVFIAHP